MSIARSQANDPFEAAVEQRLLRENNTPYVQNSSQNLKAFALEICKCSDEFVLEHEKEILKFYTKMTGGAGTVERQHVLEHRLAQAKQNIYGGESDFWLAGYMLRAQGISHSYHLFKCAPPRESREEYLSSSQIMRKKIAGWSALDALGKSTSAYPDQLLHRMIQEEYEKFCDFLARELVHEIYGTNPQQAIEITKTLLNEPTLWMLSMAQFFSSADHPVLHRFAWQKYRESLLDTMPQLEAELAKEKRKTEILKAMLPHMPTPIYTSKSSLQQRVKEQERQILSLEERLKKAGERTYTPPPPPNPLFEMQQKKLADFCSRKTRQPQSPDVDSIDLYHAYRETCVKPLKEQKRELLDKIEELRQDLRADIQNAIYKVPEDRAGYYLKAAVQRARPHLEDGPEDNVRVAVLAQDLEALSSAFENEKVILERDAKTIAAQMKQEIDAIPLPMTEDGKPIREPETIPWDQLTSLQKFQRYEEKVVRHFEEENRRFVESIEEQRDHFIREVEWKRQQAAKKKRDNMDGFRK